MKTITNIMYDKLERAFVMHQSGSTSKEQDCTCGLDENGQWSDEVFDRFGCDCGEEVGV